MAIRMIAAELYSLQREVARLEKKLAETPFTEQAPVRDTLRKKRAEYNRMRKVLDGMKDKDRKH
jgi:hypothetical protein